MGLEYHTSYNALCLPKNSFAWLLCFLEFPRSGTWMKVPVLGTMAEMHMQMDRVKRVLSLETYPCVISCGHIGHPSGFFYFQTFQVGSKLTERE